MRLALGLGDVHEVGIRHRRLLQHRPGDRDVVVLGELADNTRRRIGHRRDTARQLRQRLGLDLLDQAADDVVEQRDMVVVEHALAPSRNKVGDAAKRLGPLFRRAVLDDVFQFGKQRRGSTHTKTH